MLEALLKRDRSFVLAGLIVIILLSWIYLVYLAQDMTGMGMAMNGDAAASRNPDAGVAMTNETSQPKTNDMGMNSDTGVSKKNDAAMPTNNDMGMAMNKDTSVSKQNDTGAATNQTMGAAMALPQTQIWNLSEFMLMFVMWATMMVAMMLPSAAPMILLFAAANRKQAMAFSPFERTSAFVVGYLVVWAVFALLATGAQGVLHSAALLSPMMATTSSLLAALLLLVAGLFQWTPLKYACLRQCRSPLAFLLNGWRPGTLGALRMGIEHGTYCLGCCWALMVLLFVAGVMNLLWIAILAVLVLVEKVAPAGQYLSRLAGIVLVIWGIWLAVSTLA